MTLTLYTTRNRQLTKEQADENMRHLAQSVNHSFLQSGSGATPESIQTFARRFVFPEMYGAVGDGVTDDSTAWTDALARIASGGTLMCAPGATYKFSSQVTVTSPEFDRICIMGFGAEITTAGAISGLKITGGSTTGGVSVYGLKINHRGNADATYGFDIIQAWYARLYDCFVEAHGVGATYAAYHIANATAATDSTGSFWTHLIGCGCRKRSGSDTGNMPFGILMEGAANATKIIGGALGHVTTALKMQNHSGQTTVPNGVLVQGMAFEGYTTAVHVEGATTSNITGHSYIGNRFENGTTVFSYTGVTTQPAEPPYIGGNAYTSNAGTHLNNPNSLYINVADMSITPDIQSSLIQNQAFKFRTISGSAHAMDVQVGGGARGIVLRQSTGTTIAQLVWSGTGTGTRLIGAGTGLAVMLAKSISGTSTEANNLRGQVTFPGDSATVAVDFGTDETDATYFVVVTGNEGENFWVTSKATTGFTINSDNVTSTAVVDWVLIR